MITLLYHILEHLVFVKKHILFEHLKRLIDTITLICTDKKNTTPYHTIVDSMSTDTWNETKHLIEQTQLNKASNVNGTVTVLKNKEQMHFFFFQCQYIRWDRSPSHEKKPNNDKNNNP